MTNEQGRPGEDTETAFLMTSRFHTADDDFSLRQPGAAGDAVGTANRRNGDKCSASGGMTDCTDDAASLSVADECARKSQTTRRPADHLSELVSFIAIDEGTDPCWHWIGVKAKGYGQFGGIAVHRWMLEYWRGERLGCRHAEHRCRNAACVNPTHLRPATSKQNQENVGVRRDNKTGYRGVYRCGNKFRAQVKHNGKVIALGIFSTAEEAGARARAARMLLFTHNDGDWIGDD